MGERVESRGELTVSYSCGACTYFKGESKLPVEKRGEVEDSITSVWEKHNEVMHKGLGKLNIGFK